jgi:HEAT repeat protein
MGRPAFAPLVDQLDNPSSTTRRNSAWAIGELTNMVPGERVSATTGLVALLNDANAWVRMAAARALGELRDRRATERLMAMLLDADWRARQMAAWALSELKDDQAVAALGSVLLSDARSEVRKGAAEALGEIKSAEALPFLRQAVNDPEPAVSAKAHWAIAEIEDTDG